MAVGPETSPPPAAGRPLPFGRRPMRTFALVIALPALVLYAVSVLLVVAALQDMAGEMNRLEQQRGVTSMHAALDFFLNGMGRAVADEGTWDEAYLNVVATPDPAWMDSTWGATARLGESYDTVLVTDQAGAIVFGADAAGRVTGNIVDRYPVTRTLLANLDKGIAATTDATTITGFAADKGGPVGLAAISVHRQTPSGSIAVPRQSRRILWIARHLTPNLLQEFAGRFQTPLAVLASTVEPGASSLDLTNADGKVIGTVTWTPDRPGDAAFQRAILLTSLVFLATGCGLLVGLFVLRAAILRRAAEPAPPAHAAPATIAAAHDAPHPAQGKGPRQAGLEPAEGPDLLDGINPQAFQMAYQPILDLRSEALVGVEALPRWTGPDGAPVLAEALSPRDRARLLDRAGPLAIRHAAGDLAPLPGLLLTVPVTPAQLGAAVFSEKVAGMLGALGFPARRLQLCVAAGLLPEVGRLAPQLAELRRRGVAITIDDFALGSVTAAYLDAGLIDRIRLSPALIDLETAAGAALLSASVEAAQKSGAAVAASGIVRKQQALALLRRGCREFQGELLARPMPIADLARLVLAPAEPAKRAS